MIGLSEKYLGTLFIKIDVERLSTLNRTLNLTVIYDPNSNPNSNANRNKQFMRQLHVSEVPSFVFFKDGVAQGIPNPNPSPTNTNPNPNPTNTNPNPNPNPNPKTSWGSLEP